MDQTDLFSTNMLVFGVIVAIVYIAAQWRIFEKAGKPGWAAIIPIYNFIVLLEIVGKPWYWILLMLIPGVNFVLAIWVVNLLSKSFGQGVGFTFGLLFLGFIFYPMLAFGNYEYVGPTGNHTIEQVQFYYSTLQLINISFCIFIYWNLFSKS